MPFLKTGGKQYRVAPGDVIRVPKLTGDVGSDNRILREFWRSLATPAKCWPAPRPRTIRSPAPSPANDRAKKVLVFKFKRKKQYKRTIGHRQDYTEVRVGDIVA